MRIEKEGVCISLDGFIPWFSYECVDGAVRGGLSIDPEFDIQSHYAISDENECLVWLYWYL